MSEEQSPDVGALASELRLNPLADVLVTASGEVVASIEGETHVLRGLSAPVVRDILTAVESERTVDGVIGSLPHYDPDDLRTVLHELTGNVLASERSVAGPADQASEMSIVVFGAGRLASAIRAELARFVAPRVRVRAAAMPAVLPESLATHLERTVLAPRDAGVVDCGQVAEHSGEPAEVDLEGVRLAVFAVENARVGAVLAMAQTVCDAGVSMLFVTPRAKTIAVGPLFVPGASPCLECALLQLEPGLGLVQWDEAPGLADCLRVFDSGRFPPSWIEAVGEVTSELARTFLQGNFDNTGIVVQVAEHRIQRSIVSDGRCRLCSRSAASSPATNERLGAAARTVDVEASHYADARFVPRAVRTLGIVGGGTAGYLTALACRQRHPELEITLIESPDIPIIGVGEATTPSIVLLLHDTLNIDKAEFYERVRPTWKLGIKFVWGASGDYYYNYPFSAAALVESQHYAQNVNLASLESVLMSEDLAPVLRLDGGEYLSLLDRCGHAYHLENARFVSYLRDTALARGIVVLERTIEQVQVNDARDEVRRLVTDRGEHLEYDLYVDCTGFRSRLLGDALGSPYTSFADSLFTDAAVVGRVPNGERPRPYTTAETMDSGWCWNIPLPEGDSCGYVYSSRFCTADEAERELRVRYRGLGDTRVVRFRTGRHAAFWTGNVAAVGNSYGFVEPLESTGIHMICEAATALAKNLHLAHRDPFCRRTVSDKLAQQWDYLRWFLAVHYRFNGRSMSPFWRECRASVDVSGLRDEIDSFSAFGPLSRRIDASQLHGSALGRDGVFGVAGLDTHLLGQRVPTENVNVVMDGPAWQRWLERIRALAAVAVPQHEALTALRSRPGLLCS